MDTSVATFSPCLAMDTRFQPPRTALQVEPTRSSSLNALALGLLVSTGTSVALAFLVTVVYRLLRPDMPMTMHERLPMLMHVSQYSYLYVWMALAGLGLAALGGYVCARVARAKNIWLGLSLACLIELFRVILFAQTGQSQVIFMILAALTIASVLLGTALGLERARS